MYGPARENDNAEDMNLHGPICSYLGSATLRQHYDVKTGRLKEVPEATAVGKAR